jgi:hypothetical protein
MTKWWVPVALVCVTACSRSAERQSNAGAPTLVATIHEIMEHIVAPSADEVWNSTAVLTDESGVHDLSPQSDAEWEKLRGAAVMLAEAPNLMAAPGRKVVPPGETIGAGGTLDAAAIQERMDEQHAEFATNAAALQASAVKALKAIDARDKKALADIGGEIDEVCESCHKRFWYPEDVPAKP